MRLHKQNLLLSIFYENGITYPVPTSISYLWNFGFMSLIFLGIQLITGIFLAMHYAAHIDIAFLSVEHIMRDVNYGWLLRYIHANGASMFFLVVYVHIFRGLYYGSYMYPREFVWIIGVVIYFLMIGTAFMGYVLPWGQMSFWAATVITNLVSAFPVIGKPIVLWLWGGFSVDNATLNRFFSFHYLLPFVLLGLVFVHIILLHDPKSSNPLGTETIKVDKIPFMPYFGVKDLLGAVLFFFLFFYFIYFNPNMLGHPDNYIPANPLVTPTHIVPEWYFLPMYAILRVVPSKLGGVLLMLVAIFVLALLPFMVCSEIRSGQFRPFYKLFFWLFFFNCLLLGWLGGNPAEEPFTEVGAFCTIFYFVYFFLILPLIMRLESFFWLDK